MPGLSGFNSPHGRAVNTCDHPDYSLHGEHPTSMPRSPLARELMPCWLKPFLSVELVYTLEKVLDERSDRWCCPGNGCYSTRGVWGWGGGGGGPVWQQVIGGQGPRMRPLQGWLERHNMCRQPLTDGGAPVSGTWSGVLPDWSCTSMTGFFITNLLLEGQVRLRAGIASRRRNTEPLASPEVSLTPPHYQSLG
jgi:hypothetical protein